MDLLFFSVKSLWICFLPPLIILLFYYYQNPANNPAVPIYSMLGILTVLFIKNHRRRLIERTKDCGPIHHILFHGTGTASSRDSKLMFTTFFALNYPRSGNSNRPFPLLQDFLRLEFNQRSLRNFAIDTANKMVASLIHLLAQAAAGNDIVDIQAVLERFDFDNICKVVFGKDLPASSKRNPEEILRDNVTSFITAGRETTSSVLTWLFWRLSSRRDVEKRILEEVKLMRPVPVDTQWNQEGFITPDGRLIGNDWATTFCAHEARRMREIWGDPEEFRPERFLQDGVFWQEWQNRLPFHGEPMMCTGMEMVYIQTKSITASMLERFEINAVKEDPQPQFSMTLRMRGGLPVRVKERA